MAKARKNSDPLIGAHMSIAGGLQKALIRGSELRCRTVQIFTKNATQWKATPLSDESILTFKDTWKQTDIDPVVVHDSYLINIASPDPKKLGASRTALLDEMERTEALGIPYLVMHPGAHMGSGEDAGIRQIVGSLNALHKKTKGFQMKVLLETTAGQGTNLGYRFEQIEAMIGSVAEPERLGVCVDTCHIFAAGYDIGTREGYEQTMEKLLALFGREKILCFHVNDSQKGLESRVDRHAHIGKGEIGLEAFQCLMQDSRFEDVPKILETPKGDTDEMDTKNMDILRKLAGQRRK
jgi:deoxyribonuclease-4